jgi:hypothetical protein
MKVFSGFNMVYNEIRCASVLCKNSNSHGHHGKNLGGLQGQIRFSELVTMAEPTS